MRTTFGWRTFEISSYSCRKRVNCVCSSPALGRVAQHFQHDHFAGALALGEIHARGAADRELAHEALAANRHRSELRQALRFRPGAQQCELLAALRHGFAQHVGHAAMIDAFARETVDGAALHCTLRQCRVVAAREIQDRRETVAMEQVLEPLLALTALDAVIEHDGVVADGGEPGVQPARLQGCVDAAFRRRPDDGDVLLDRATELRVIGNDQQARCDRAVGDFRHTARIAFNEPRCSCLRRVFASSERSACSRARYSGVTSPVTYAPEKHEVVELLDAANRGAGRRCRGLRDPGRSASRRR